MNSIVVLEERSKPNLLRVESCPKLENIAVLTGSVDNSDACPLGKYFIKYIIQHHLFRISQIVERKFLKVFNMHC
jgi:hypothetical protein